MLVLINTNRMVPPIAPIGLDYIAASTREGGIGVDVLDLCLEDDPQGALRRYFAVQSPELVGLSFRNIDDSFFPHGEWFVPPLKETIQALRGLTDAPIVVGGVGFSILPERIVEYTGADFGIHGDGEEAIVSLVTQLRGRRRLEKVPGLLWRDGGKIRSNAPAWGRRLSLLAARDAVDNRAYFRRGGQGSVETNYCADPLAKGRRLRLRDPSEVADEVESLLKQGIDVLHLCDGEFNVPGDHAMAVCEEFVRRSLGDRVRWYTYMAVVPFDQDLSQAMRRAGCVGIDFTGDSACESMLETFRHRHRKEDLELAARLCHHNGITVMFDLLLGAPGETPETVAETIGFMKQIDPDCVGAALGVRVYPGTRMGEIVASEGSPETNPNIRRKYEGPVDFLKPTFYISAALGESPAKLVRDMIAGDPRFFAPEDDKRSGQKKGPRGDHDYNRNTVLMAAIASGARGAYWDILRRARDALRKDSSKSPQQRD
jgi:radical SAM superfamily enzyme YgiQ (UPF0313 family)